MCPVGYLRRGVVDTTNACYPVGDTVCNLYTIYKRSRARSSAHLTVAVFCPDWLLLWMWGRQCGQCPIFSLPPFAPTVQLAHSVCKQISSSLVLPLWFPCMFCFFPLFVHGPSDKPWKQMCKNKQIVHSLYPLQTIQTLKCFFFQLEMSK